MITCSVYAVLICLDCLTRSGGPYRCSTCAPVPTSTTANLGKLALVRASLEAPWSLLSGCLPLGCCG